ncbi:VOC family protein [Aquimarina sp. W85]|uniref:VOC family protein n=1 Tax=Aquimarina rhodophyticola TaxID=3342246 RepID=UPI00366CD468
MKRHLGAIKVVVNDYDEAISYYTKSLGFVVIEDLKIDNTKRWVVIAPNQEAETQLILGKAANETQKLAIGNQTGGRVFLFLHTDDFWRDYNFMKDKGVVFKEEPREEPYGTVVVFEDLYGNTWDLIEKTN